MVTHINYKLWKGFKGCTECFARSKCPWKVKTNDNLVTPPRPSSLNMTIYDFITHMYFFSFIAVLNHFYDFCIDWRLRGYNDNLAHEWPWHIWKIWSGAISFLFQAYIMIIVQDATTSAAWNHAIGSLLWHLWRICFLNRVKWTRFQHI